MFTKSFLAGFSWTRLPSPVCYKRDGGPVPRGGLGVLVSVLSVWFQLVHFGQTLSLSLLESEFPVAFRGQDSLLCRRIAGTCSPS